MVETLMMLACHECGSGLAAVPAGRVILMLRAAGRGLGRRCCFQNASGFEV